jgi:hypothetical protein
MYATLVGANVISISGLNDPALFFKHIAKIMVDEDGVIGIASFMPAKQVAEWLNSLPEINVPRRFDFKQLTKSIADDPAGGAFYFSSTRAHLDYISRLAAAVDSSEMLCSHVIGFYGDSSMFSFHDAFGCDDMLVSPDVPQKSIDTFCHATGGKYRIVANSKFFDS